MVDALDLHGVLPEDYRLIPEGSRLTALSPRRQCARRAYGPVKARPNTQFPTDIDIELGRTIAARYELAKPIQHQSGLLSMRACSTMNPDCQEKNDNTARIKQNLTPTSTTGNENGPAVL
jgi:hypothetical protein